MRLRALVSAAILLPACGHAGSALRAQSSPSPTPVPISTGDFPLWGHAADFSWVSGRYESSLAHGCAVVTFSATPRAPWGGKLSLVAPPGRLAGFADGDMVVIHGDFDRAPNGACGRVAYSVTTIEEH